jgi:hypothetical protein
LDDNRQTSTPSSRGFAESTLVAFSVFCFSLFPFPGDFFRVYFCLVLETRKSYRYQNRRNIAIYTPPTKSILLLPPFSLLSAKFTKITEIIKYHHQYLQLLQVLLHHGPSREHPFRDLATACGVSFSFHCGTGDEAEIPQSRTRPRHQLESCSNLCYDRQSILSKRHAAARLC